MMFKIIACQTIAEELAAEHWHHHQIVPMSFGLHHRPEELQETLQAEIDKPSPADAVLLGYGLCSRGTLGLQARKKPLVIPRLHDCIGILLGSQEEYHRRHRKEPGTYYLSTGWIKHGTDPYKEFLRWQERFSEEKALRLMKRMLCNYKSLVLIETGAEAGAEEQSYARYVAEVFKLEFKKVRSSNAILQKLLSGAWDDEFIVLHPGENTRAEMFI